MDEEVIQDNQFIIDDPAIIDDSINVVEESDPVQKVETVEYIEIVPDQTIVVGSQEAFPPLGEDNENLNHGRLYGRDSIDQHPITAITGLRDELDNIESLKVVYSDEKYYANYYMWQDENTLNENRVGYFVAMHSDGNKIRISTNDDNIYGITVPIAGFVGGQDDIARDERYGLVVYSGSAPVRCETNVVAGDYVISSDYGMAAKATDNYGFYVSAISEIDGVRYAIVSLATPSTQVQILAEKTTDLRARMTSAEANIVAATNLANSAYDKANDVEGWMEELNETLVEQINEIIGKVDGVVDDFERVDNMTQVANQTAVRAQVIAEGALSTAESLRNEVTDKTDQAIGEALKAQEELAQVRDEVNIRIDQSEEKIQGVLDKTQEVSNELSDLANEMEPLSSWTSVDGTQTGVSGFVSKADADSTLLAQISEWKSDASESLAGVITKADKNAASITSIAEWQSDKESSIASIQAKVDENEASITSLTERQTEDGKTISLIEQRVTDNEGEISTLVGKQTETNNTLAGVSSRVDENSANVESLTSRVTDTEQGVASVKTTADKNKTEIQSLVSWKSEAVDNIASVKSTADANKSEIENLTTYIDANTTNIASLQQKADANGAMIQGMVTNFSNYVVGMRSQRYGLTATEAAGILEDGMVYIPLANHAEVYDTYANQQEYEYEFTKGFYYTWGNSIWNESTSDAVFFSQDYVAGSEKSPYWVLPYGDDVIHNGITYKSERLYKWENDQWNFVATLNNNATVGLVQQTANEILLSVGGSGGDVAALKLRVDANESSIQSMAAHIKGDFTRLDSWDALPELDRNVNVIYYSVDTGLYWYYGDSNDDGAADKWLSTEDSYEAGLIGSLATIQQQADDNGATLGMIVQGTGEDAKLKRASIVASVNEDDGSFVNINAENINFEGYSTFIGTDENGTITSIDGNLITTGAIKSSNYEKDVLGSLLNLTNGSFDAAHFKINSAGEITATGGTIGGWTMYSGTGKPIETTTAIEDKWNSLFSHNTTNNEDVYTIFDASRQFVIATGVPSDKAFNDHSHAKFKVENTGALYIGGQNAAFTVTANGKVTATDAVIEGEITTEKGRIGQWDIGTSKLSNNDGKVFLDGSASGNALVIKAGSNFSVTANGNLTATNATISGNVTANSISVTNFSASSAGVSIGGFDVGTNAIYKSVAQSNYKGEFSSYTTYSAGSYVTYAGTIYYTASGYTGGTSGGIWSGKWTRVSSDIFEHEEVYLGTDKISLGGRFLVTKEGALYASNATISGNITANSIDVTNFSASSDGVSIGGFTVTEDGLTANIISGSTTVPALVGPGILTYGVEDANTHNLVEVSKDRIYMTGFDSYLYLHRDEGELIFDFWSSPSRLYIDANRIYMGGSVETTNPPYTYSDRNRKNSIELLQDNYEILYDELIPCRFKYNDGTSGRYHTGFIAQEVDNARNKAGLTRQDVAIICISNEGTEDESWALRYDEFVALNTWQIQKLKQRITELEERLNALE